MIWNIIPSGISLPHTTLFSLLWLRLNKSGRHSSSTEMNKSHRDQIRVILLLLSYSLDRCWKNVVLLISLQFIEEFHVTEQLDRWSPVVVKHSPGAGFRLTLRLYVQHYTDSFHHQLHKTWRVLHTHRQTDRHRHTQTDTQIQTDRQTDTGWQQRPRLCICIAR